MRAEPNPEASIKRIALETGFSLVGIAGSVHPPLSKSIYNNWLVAGKQAGLHYLIGGRDKRDDPQLLLPGARSILSVALNYFPGRLGPAGLDGPQGRRGRFSLYAHGLDYHQVMGEKLERMAAAMSKRFPELRSASCVDTRPVAERTWALQAGIGWLGRNTCVISPEFGSWLFLGELVTNLDLKPDRPLSSSCGDCRLCIEACPTGALGEDFTLAANRCLSYLTIEHRGDIPERFHRPMADRIFGCDECQRVCPHNTAALPTRTPDFKKKHPVTGLDLETIINMSDQELRAATRESVTARCGPAGLKRNARIVLANLNSR